MDAVLETILKISIGLIIILIIFVFPNKTRTWFKGYGACDWHGQCYRKAVPRNDCITLVFNEVEWYCDNHYDMKKQIKRKVDAEYKRGTQKNTKVMDK